MTVTDPAPLVCPECGGTNTDIGGSGNGMCFDCAHIGPPETFTAATGPALAPFGIKSEAEVFDAGSADAAIGPAAGGVGPVQERTHPPAPDDITGYVDENPRRDWFDAPPPRLAPPSPHDFPETWSGLAQFRSAGGSMSNEQWWADIMGSPPDNIDPVPELTPEPPVHVQAALVMASQIIDAGLRTACVVAEPHLLLDVPTGYLPSDAALWPVVEQACAIAIGMLIDGTDATPRDLAGWFGIDLDNDNTGDPTTEETHGEGPTEAT